MKISHGEELYTLGCNTVYSVENKPTFRSSMSPLSSGPKNKPDNPSMQQAASRVFDPEGGFDVFFPNGD
jgi:hypothetical protein